MAFSIIVFTECQHSIGVDNNPDLEPVDFTFKVEGIEKKAPDIFACSKADIKIDKVELEDETTNYTNGKELLLIKSDLKVKMNSNFLIS